MESIESNVQKVSDFKEAREPTTSEITTRKRGDRQKLFEAGYSELCQNLPMDRKHEEKAEKMFMDLSERIQKRLYKEMKKLHKTRDLEKDGQDANSMAKHRRKEWKDKKGKGRRHHKGDKCDKSEKRKHGRHGKWKHEKKDKHLKMAEKLKTWPEGITHVFFDGHNMLFEDKAILKMQAAHNVKEAEEAVANIAFEFSKAKGNFDAVLVFDRAQQHSQKEVIGKDGLSVLEFNVCSASPSYRTSAHALFDFISKERTFDECLLVTSDESLQLKAKELGLKHIMKSKKWFKLVKKDVGFETYHKIISDASFSFLEKEGLETERRTELSEIAENMDDFIIE